MSVLNQFNNQVQNLPFYNQVSGLYEDQVGQRFSTKDPFYEKVPEKDKSELKPGEKMEYKEIRRKPPPNISEQQRKLWKQIMKRAWYHDRNLCGCMPIDLGLGMISVVSIFPIIGSAIAYKMHYKLIKMCNQAGCPKKIQAEMVGNIGLDFVITLVPLLGVLLSWMKASSTRNAALFDTWLRQQSSEKDALASRQNQQLASLQRSRDPSRPAPSATRAPPTRPQQRQPQSQQPQQRQGTQSRAVNSPYGPPRSNAPYGPPKSAPRASGATKPSSSASTTATRPQQSTQTRPPVTQAPRTQGQPPRTQGQPPRAQGYPPRAQPPQSQASRASAQGQPQPAERPVAGGASSYYDGPGQQQYGYPPSQPRGAQHGAPPVPPKVPAGSPRRIPPAGSSIVGEESPYGPPRSTQGSPYGPPRAPSSESPYGPPHASPYGSQHASPYGSQHGSPYGSQPGSPYGSPYGPQYGLPYGPTSSAAAPQSYMQAPSQSYRPQPPAHQQKYFMQPAVRSQPEVVQR